MAIVTGEIESLSRLKKELHAKGIYRFNSVKDIQNFQKNYIDERNAILDQVSKKIASELKKQEEEVEELRKTVEELNSQIQTENIAIQESFQNLKTLQSYLRSLAIRFLYCHCGLFASVIRSDLEIKRKL